MKTNDLAGKALVDTQMKSLGWMLMSRVKRGETLRLDDLNTRLMERLKTRCREMERKSLDPQNTTDWLALALFAQDREALVQRFQQAERENDKIYHHARYWLKTIMEQRERDQG